MARTTDVNGDFSLVVKTKDKKEFLKAWEIIAGCLGAIAFPTWVEQIPAEPYYDALQDCWQDTMDFHAMGDGTYENNIRKFGEWLDGLGKGLLPDEDKIFLEGLDFRIKYGFAEHADGGDSIALMRMMNEHEAGTPLWRTKTVVVKKEEHITATAASLDEYDLSDEEEEGMQ